MSHSSRKQQYGLSRPTTPELSLATQQQLGLPPRSLTPVAPRSRSTTPDLSLQTHQQRLPLQPLTQLITKNHSTASDQNRVHQGQQGLPSQPPATVKSCRTPVVLQSKEGPEILKLLKEGFQMIDNKLTCLNQKVDAITQRLNTLEAAVKVCQSSNDDSFHRPNYLPFKTQADILKYNESSDAQVTEMVNSK
ncbi:uncharacterized protein LOC141532029 isoform X2 [Cotesia typhae]|uniref:uncharacterized protein LOC141532029 isoform X2 n=1 Tax=Cotesia typhae TaxID=2053667 RepID=UPI003D682D80